MFNQVDLTQASEKLSRYHREAEMQRARKRSLMLEQLSEPTLGLFGDNQPKIASIVKTPPSTFKAQ